MKILITGATGFIGKCLVGSLKNREFKVVEFRGRVENKNSYPSDNFDVIIHLAALITHKKGKEPTEKELIIVNVEGTKNLQEYYPDAKFILISTTDIERAELSFYARTKLEAEKIISQKAENLIVRLPSVFGPNQTQDKLIPRLIKHYYLGKECQINNNDEKEYIFIDDVCEGIIDHLGGSGRVTLRGIKIRNLRLNELIRSIHDGIRPVFENGEEERFFNHLKLCCETIEK